MREAIYKVANLLGQILSSLLTFLVIHNVPFFVSFTMQLDALSFAACPLGWVVDQILPPCNLLLEEEGQSGLCLPDDWLVVKPTHVSSLESANVVLAMLKEARYIVI